MLFIFMPFFYITICILVFAEEGVCTSYSDITQNNFNCPNKTGIPLPQNAEGCSFFYCLGNDCTGLNQRGCPRISSNGW